MNVDGGFQLGDLAGIVRRRGEARRRVRRAVVALAAYWIAMALPNVYTSYATVLVEPQSVVQGAGAGRRAGERPQRAPAPHDRADPVARRGSRAIIDELELYKEESKYLLREEIIDLMRERDPRRAGVPGARARAAAGRRDVAINEFRIFFDDYDATIARDVAQRLANDFIESHINARVQLSQKSLEFIQGELERLADADPRRRGPDRAGQERQSGQAARGSRREPAPAGARIVATSPSRSAQLAEAESDEAFYRSQVAQRGVDGGAERRRQPGAPPRAARSSRSAEYASRGFTEKHPDVIRTKAEIETLEQSGRRAEGAARRASKPIAELQQQSAEAESRRADAAAQAAAGGDRASPSRPTRSRSCSARRPRWPSSSTR